MEYRLDRANRRARLSRILWRPDKTRGEGFQIAHNDHANGYRFTSAISGTAKEYLFDIPYRYAKGYVLYMESNDRWRPVSAVASVARIACTINHKGYPTTNPGGEFADLDPFDCVFWNDDNRDGKVQRAECEIVKTNDPFGTVENKKKNPRPGIPLRGWWGTGIGDDFMFYAYAWRQPVTEYKPIGFSAEGAPRYGSVGMRQTNFNGGGDLVPVTDEERLLIMPSSGGLDTVVESRNPTTGEQH